MDSLSNSATTSAGRFLSQYIQNPLNRWFNMGSTGNVEFIWDYLKSLMFGIPQTYGLISLFELMRKKVHWNEYRQVGM